jgi:heat shock protein HslJ
MVTAVNLVTQENSRAQRTGAFVGGGIGLATGSGQSGSNRALRTIGGGFAGQQIARLSSWTVGAFVARRAGRFARMVGSVLVLTACAVAPDDPPRGGAPDNSSDRINMLEAHDWRLESAKDGRGQSIVALSPRAGRAVELGFANGRVQIRGGCNLRGGSFQLTAAGHLLVDRMVTTMMACEQPLMQVDATLSSFFANPLRLDVVRGTSPRLLLVSAANDRLEFTGRSTPEARYGAPTIVFLEVAPREVACNHPVPGARCLQVRDVFYDKQGLPAGKPGEWRLLYQNIDGFSHTDGERNVLRVKRFARTPVPADASATVYVLDLVVESEILPR